MTSAFTEHWKGVAAGLAVYAAFFVYIEVSERIAMRQWEAARSAALAAVPPTTIPPPKPATPSSLPPAAVPDVPCPESNCSEAVSDSKRYSGLGNQATAVVENPYGIGSSSYSPPVLGRVLALVTFVLSGTVAALVGTRVVAWRGAVTGVLGGLGYGVIYGRVPSSELHWFALFCLSLGLLAYAGGGLAKLLARARLRPA